MSGQIHEGGSEHCVIAKELVTECDVGCPLGMAEPKILAGHEVRTRAEVNNRIDVL